MIHYVIVKFVFMVKNPVLPSFYIKTYFFLFMIVMIVMMNILFENIVIIVNCHVVVMS